MLKKILVGLVVVVVILVAVIASRPADFRVARSTVIQAPAEVVFAQLNDFHKWAAWSPWDKMDPNMKRTFGGPPTGVGTTYAWTGNDQVGEGRMTIVDAKPDQHVALKLEFIKPFAATNATDFVLSPGTEGVHIEWAMTGTNNFMGKAFALFANMDKMVGGDFARGLAQLKVVSEAEAVRVKAAAEAKAKADAAAAAAAALVAAAQAAAAPAAAAPAATAAAK